MFCVTRKECYFKDLLFPRMSLRFLLQNEWYTQHVWEKLNCSNQKLIQVFQYVCGQNYPLCPFQSQSKLFTKNWKHNFQSNINLYSNFEEKNTHVWYFLKVPIFTMNYEGNRLARTVIIWLSLIWFDYVWQFEDKLYWSDPLRLQTWYCKLIAI